MTNDLENSNWEPATEKSSDHSEYPPTNTSKERTLSDIIEARLSRRTTMKGMAAFTAVSAFGASLFGRAAPAKAAKSTLTFKEIPHSIPPPKGLQISPGYETQILMRWGDPVTGDAPKFDPNNQSVAAQEKQWGFNNDFMAYMPLPLGSQNSEHGLLCVSFEYTGPHLMFPGYKTRKGAHAKVTKEQSDIEMAAHGAGIIEIKHVGGKWQFVEGSRYNRRISFLSTPMDISGPAAGHDRLKTSADPTGRRVIGTCNNCAGGQTPWGTVLYAEENFQDYFRGDRKNTPKEARNYKRYGVPKKKYAFGKYHDRLNIDKEPNEPNRFGWVVEVDPYDPNSIPVKRTALGRARHECASTVVNPDGTVTIYSGDDNRFDYLYKFVTDGRYIPNNRAANRNLLDSGTLYVAKFFEGGIMRWLPLVYGSGPLTEKNDFHSQGDVVIETRRAADLLGATPMDRPEDVGTNPVNGRTYVMLTNNTKRKQGDLNVASPRANNKHGQIIELIPPAVKGKPKMGFTDTWPALIVADHAALEYRWNFFLMGGDPGKAESGAKYHPDTSKTTWMSSPDNVAFDNLGRVWIVTDGQIKHGFADSIYAVDPDGPARGLLRRLFNSPKGAEICGPTFTPDNRTLFVNIQHPGEEKKSTFDKPSTRWPDFKDGMPPRPSLVVITKKDGGVIGT